MRIHHLFALAITSIMAASCSDVQPTSTDVASKQSGGTLIYGLTTDNMLVSFTAEKPNQAVSEKSITGLASGEHLMGIDFRPSDLTADATNKVGMLYAAGSTGNLYTIDPMTGSATWVAMIGTPITGMIGGFGFNPVPDRIRIHGSDGQNLRINPETGAAIVDGALAFMATDANAGDMPMISATAYTNSDNDASTGTTLYAIDAGNDVLVDLPSPNNGQLRTIGSLGVDAGDIAGFDIVGASGGTAYAAFNTSASGKSTLYTIDLTTGAATSLGLIAQSRTPLVSIAVAP